jgi:hypothetical protein
MARPMPLRRKNSAANLQHCNKPPLPIWPRACSKVTWWPNLANASCHAVGMQVDGIDQGTVDTEDGGLEHL